MLWTNVLDVSPNPSVVSTGHSNTIICGVLARWMTSQYALLGTTVLFPAYEPWAEYYGSQVFWKDPLSHEMNAYADG